MNIYHILPRTTWEQALAQGEYRAVSLETEGFIHASTREQVLDTASRYYHGQQGLALLVIDPEKLGAELRYDPVMLNGEQTRFPHIYGPLNLDAVVDVLDFSPNADGGFSWPGEI
jgi:uncharacterized protein (DUF952 family)